MRRVSIALLSLIAVACARPADEASVAQAGTANDRAAVQSVIDAHNVRFADAFMKGDTATMSGMYTADAWVLPAGAPIARGPAEIVQAHGGFLSQMSVTNASLKSTDVILAGDYAIETGIYTMRVKPKRGGGAAMDDVGKYIVVWQKQADGSWKIVRDIWNADKSAQ